MIVASKRTPPVMTPWLKKPIPPMLSGLFMSGSRPDASASRTLRSCGDEASKRSDTRVKVLVGVMYWGLGRVKSEVWYRPWPGSTGFPLG